YYNLGYLGLRKEEKLIALQEDPNSPERRKILEGSIPLFKKAIEINVHYYKAYYFLGICYMKMGQNDRAKAQFRELIELNKSGKWAQEARNILRQFQ
ncbi:MAG: tetratricopeptide repeat protein, partial [Candidatus Heimdallarchaeota archaeon]|nr:tetratricopeptide repeat protein [Candidatus Heimdallarchaeota archaeon]